jgi:hypothetical protein
MGKLRNALALAVMVTALVATSERSLLGQQCEEHPYCEVNYSGSGFTFENCTYSAGHMADLCENQYCPGIDAVFDGFSANCQGFCGYIEGECKCIPIP